MSSEYQVEAIRDVRVRKGKKEYYIKWENYPESYNTWEPFLNLRKVRDMIEEFEEKWRIEKNKDSESSEENYEIS